MSSRKTVTCLLCLGLATVGNAIGRQKRELRFPKGASFVAAVALASFLPKGPTDGFAHVLEFDLGFPFPEIFSIDKKQTLKKSWKYPDVIKGKDWHKPTLKGKRRRAKRNSRENEKKRLLLKVEDAISRIGFNGSSCVSRFRCELMAISPHTLLEQMLVTLFRPDSEPDSQDCEKHLSACQISLLQIVMHSEQISSSRVV